MMWQFLCKIKSVDVSVLHRTQYEGGIHQQYKIVILKTKLKKGKLLNL